MDFTCDGEKNRKILKKIIKIFLTAVLIFGILYKLSTGNRPYVSMWGFSSVGRAPALQAGGQEFESLNLHHLKTNRAADSPIAI